jgi:F-box/WD-40 domain protein 7
VTCLYFDQEQDLIVSGSLDYDIRFWHLSTGECCQKIDWISKEGHRGVIRTLKADSWRVVSGADDKTIKVRMKTKKMYHSRASLVSSHPRMKVV